MKILLELPRNVYLKEGGIKSFGEEKFLETEHFQYFEDATLKSFLYLNGWKDTR